MNLRKRISKLKDEGKNVTVDHKEFSIVTFDGYEADAAARNFWIGAILFFVVIFFLSWWGYGIYDGFQDGNNPALIQAETDRVKQEEADKRASKQQYIDGCKSAGKTPGEMGDYKTDWECK